MQNIAKMAIFCSFSEGSLGRVLQKQTLPPFSILRDHWGFFIRRKLCFGCHQSYHIWCVDKTPLVGLAKDFVFSKYRSSSGPRQILRKMFSLLHS